MTFGEKAVWLGFTGKRLGCQESIVLMDHPKNPWSPCPWFTRDYGFASPTPFYWLENGWQLPAGQYVRLRYRVAVIAGDIVADEIRPLYNAFASSE